MRLHKYLLAIDFDLTMTCGDHINKSWGDRLSKTLRRIKTKYPVSIFILSVASMSHIFQTIVLSGSSQLLLTMLDISMITNETTDVSRVDYNWGETKKERDEMIRKVTHTENTRDIDNIVAYKKTNYLSRKSREEDIPHSHVFFLDDNGYNVRFAHYHGFQAFQVDNKDKEKNIFKRLGMIERFIKENYKK